MLSAEIYQYRYLIIIKLMTLVQVRNERGPLLKKSKDSNISAAA